MEEQTQQPVQEKIENKPLIKVNWKFIVVVVVILGVLVDGGLLLLMPQLTTEFEFEKTFASKEIQLTSPLFMWFLGLFVGVLGLMIFVFRVLFLQREVLRLLKEREPEEYKKLIGVSSLGVPMEISYFPLWPAVSWRVTKFFLAKTCTVSNEEICRRKKYVRRLLFIYLIGFVVWVVAFLGLWFAIVMS